MGRRRTPPRRSTLRANPAAERAVRAATTREPWLPPGFVIWAMGRVLAIALLAGAGWLAYDCASSARYQVRSIRVHGNALLTQTEVERTAGVIGANIFWIDRSAVAARLLALPVVQHVEVAGILPDLLDVTVVERQPAAFWTSGEQSYLVDREGVILKSVDAETEQARACAGAPCDPRLAPLPTVARVDGPALTPGDRVDANALATAAHLTTLLPAVGVQPLSFDWSPETGLEVPTRDGWRARFDETGNLDQQVATLRSIRDELTRTRAGAELIDVRFGDRPYFR